MGRRRKTHTVIKGIRKTSQLHFNCFSKLEQKRIKNIIVKIKFFNIPSLKRQAFELFDEIKKDDEFPSNKKTYSSISLLFGLKQQNFRNLVLMGEKIANKTSNPVGRPSLINDFQKQQLLTKIKQQNKERKSMGREDVVKFVESEFHITPQSSWVDYFVNKNADEIAFVNAKPMESERLGVTKEIIDKHFENLKYFLAKCDPNLIINMDETGDQLKAKSSNKRVLLSVKEDTQNHYYREQRSDSHISFVAAIATDFTFFRPMVITTTKSSCEDIEHLGLPDGSFGLIVGSPNGYMTSDLMEMWIKKILLPEIEYRRMGMNKKNAVAGLILDGHTSHINEVTKELFQKNKVEYFLLPPT